MDNLSNDSILQMAASALLHRCDRIALVDVATLACRFIKHPAETPEDLKLQGITNIVTYFRNILSWGLIHTDDLLECHRRLQQFIANAERRMEPTEHTLRLRYRHGDGFAWMELSLLPVPGQPANLRLFCLERSEDNHAGEALRGVWGQFHKILRVDLASGAYEPVKLEDGEAGHIGEAPRTIWQWMEDFASTDHIHPDDLGTYMEFTEKMRQHHLTVDAATPCKTIYRRRQQEDWRWVIMEVLPSLEYSADNQVVMLYVLDVHDFLAENREHGRLLHKLAASPEWDARLAADADPAGALDNGGGSGPGLIFANLEGLPLFKS